MHANAMKACREKVAQTGEKTCSKMLMLLDIRGHANTFAGG